jgi:serine protein kinase
MIELDGFKWPIDTLIIANSNNSEFDTFLMEREEAPIIDRCRICYVAHNTDYKIQKTLTDYAVGTDIKRSLGHEILHQDPNLNYAASIAVVLYRLSRSDKLTPVETMKLAAGEVAGEKVLKCLPS